jgi:hypothetical protein
MPSPQVSTSVLEAFLDARSRAAMRHANTELAATLAADHAELPGLNHMIEGRALAPALAERLR